ncbi:MAG: ABC transporter permease, partial [Candidatus Hydrogenedentes bacterium]|nr:ABC transporter permease [Candidatus Hydrogenedentota bacterium]
MNFVECLYAAFDSIHQNKVRSTLTALGVIIGVMSVILLISLGEGAQAYVEQEFAGMGSNVLIVTPGKQDTMGSMVPMVADTFNKLTYENSRQIARHGLGVDEVAPVVLGAGFVRHGERRRNTAILGVSPEFETVRQIFTQIGRFVTQADIDRNNRVCVIGTAIKESLFGNKQALYERISINRTKHMIVGILETKGMSLGVNLDDIVMIPLPSAQQMFHGGED